MRQHGPPSHLVGEPLAGLFVPDMIRRKQPEHDLLP